MSDHTDPLPTNYDGRQTLWAFCLALLLLAGVEIVVRTVVPPHSGNLVHIREFDSLLSAFAAAPGPRVVFVGNSLMNNGVVPEYFSEVSDTRYGRRFYALKLVPDGTTLWDWRCIIQRLPPAREGDLLVIGYAWYQVSDQQTFSISRTFGLLCPLTELPTVTRLSGLGVGDWIEAGLARLSLTYVIRERISGGVLARIVPHYEAEVQRINDESRNNSARSNSDVAPRTYSTLTASVQFAQALGYRVVMVAMPTQTAYATDPRLADVLQGIDADYLDMRHAPWLHASLFVDSIHLGPEGARQLTSSIATHLFDGVPPLAGM